MIGRLLLGAALGGGLGFAYYKFIGCASGACPLTSNPWTATLYGAVLGLLAAAHFRSTPTPL
jgi:hypothetical protein